jgi:type IV pilus biogenesis protein PilP
MNRSHYQKTFSAKAAVAVLMASCFFSAANAQQLAPVDSVYPATGNVAPAAAPVAAPSYKLPEGASVGDAADKIKKLSSQGAQSLKELQGNAVSNEREMNDVEARSKDLREIQMLEMQVKKAELAKDLYKIINGDEDKNAAELESVKTERDELSVQVKALEEQLATTSKQLQSQVSAASEPNPVIVSITGAAGRLNAKLLVPYYGETTVGPGDTLANGQTVTSIGPNGVSVSKDGKTSKLAFGTSVPAGPRR